MLAVLDYGAGNLGSVSNALRKLNISHEVTADPAVLSQARALIVPGVGAAAPAMEALASRALDVAISSAVRQSMPVLGICLGMQLLLSRSEEGRVPTLDVVAGQAHRFEPGLKIPHIGWNQVRYHNGRLLKGLEDEYFYFVHSYYCAPESATVAGITEYGIEFCSALEQENIFGVQFHPEKSGEAGLELLRNFWRLT